MKYKKTQLTNFIYQHSHILQITGFLLAILGACFLPVNLIIGLIIAVVGISIQVITTIGWLWEIL